MLYDSRFPTCLPVVSIDISRTGRNIARAEGNTTRAGGNIARAGVNNS